MKYLFSLRVFVLADAPRRESDLFAYRSMWQALVSLVRQGPSHLFRGAAASALRDAPYAGLFLVSYEQIKHESGTSDRPILPSSLSPPSSQLRSCTPCRRRPP